MGLALDEPTENDQVHEVEGLRFVLDGELAKGLKAYLPVKVDYDSRFFTGIRVRASRHSSCC